MTSVLYAMTLVAFFGGAFLLGYALIPVRSPGDARVVGFARVDMSRIPSTFFKFLYPLMAPLAPIFKLVRWPSYRERMNVQLQRAGLGEFLSFEHIFAAKVLCAIFLPLLIALVVEIVRNPAVFVLVAFGAFYLPDRLVGDLRKKRERQIVRALPGTVDVLSLSVEAGLEFLMAIQRVVERGGIGPLRDELATVLNDIRLGKSRGEALKGFASRVEIPEVSSFVSVLVQADQLGASIGPVLQSQAERMRTERFQRAEKSGAKASQKILFPLVLFIFPAVIIVIVAPVVLNYIYGQ